MELTIYKRTVCSNCAQIMAILNAKQIDYKVVNMDEHPEAMQMVQKRGFHTAPILFLQDENGEEIDNASGKAILDVMNWHQKGLI